ncbi:MAG: hypothetical protein QOE90_528 [Thermoplasmata archaeon]|jgi:hypothetical protein|nr:hypothetical protein [Thermoplasmata archaeon]
MSALRALLAFLLGLPLGASALIVLASPPLSGLLPAAALPAVRSWAAPLFALVARLPPDSPAGRAFYASYAPLVPIFGAGALAAHALLLSLPVVALLVAVLRVGKRSCVPAP